MRRRRIATLTRLLAATLAAAASGACAPDDASHAARASITPSAPRVPLGPTLAQGESLYWAGKIADARSLWRRAPPGAGPNTRLPPLPRLSPRGRLAPHRLRQYPAAPAAAGTPLRLK